MMVESIAAPAPYERAAVYFHDSDCVEYLRVDGFCLYERIDAHLTIIRDADGLTVVGFKLKGFRNMFERLKASLELSDKLFVPLISALESILTDVGDSLIADPAHRAAYVEAYHLAANDNVQLPAEELLEAA